MKCDRTLAWKIYYSDGSAVGGSTREEWLQAKSTGVVGLVSICDSAGRSIVPADLFHWPPWMSRPFGTDHWGVIDNLLLAGVMNEQQKLADIPVSIQFEQGIKIGRMVDNDQWRELWVAMTTDKEFPEKSANHRSERVPT